ncbi:MarR family winged helix-turn-helix transcriptional regulator [Nocardioides montaniterrae]
MTTDQERDGDVAADLYVAMVRLLRDLRRSAPKEGVAASGLSALYALSRLGPCRASALAEFEGVSAAAVTRIVDRVCELGYAERSADPDDGRAVLVGLTAAGRKVVAAGAEARISDVRRRIGTLPAVDQARLAELAPLLHHLVEG